MIRFFRGGFLSLPSLCASLNQSSHSLLTSLINNVFPPTEQLLTWCFLFFPPYCVINSRDCCVGENCRKSAVSKLLKQVQTTMPLVKVAYKNVFEIKLSPGLMWKSIWICMDLWIARPHVQVFVMMQPGSVSLNFESFLNHSTAFSSSKRCFLASNAWTYSAN